MTCKFNEQSIIPIESQDRSENLNWMDLMHDVLNLVPHLYNYLSNRYLLDIRPAVMRIQGLLAYCIVRLLLMCAFKVIFIF